MDRRKQNYLITQLVKGVPLEKIDTQWNDDEHLQGRVTQWEAGQVLHEAQESYYPSQAGVE